MRGYFGIGIEGASKPLNVGTLFRSAHAFGASFAFTVDADFRKERSNITDTSKSGEQMPYYHFPNHDNFFLPTGCRMVGIELTPDAIELPSFKHPSQAAYILGPERGNLSQGMQDRCDFIIKIPMSFCVNVAIAANIVMYDRLISLGRFAPRPVRAGAPTEPKPEGQYGGWISRTREKRKGNPEQFRKAPPPDYSVIDGELDDEDDA
ncbi:RNA methyltransferase [Thalassospira lucentensis]|uniref:RNA methyltransferase n=3 Tax=Thalassospira lucentensis TaxID=168935 RepID=A0A358HPN9_9PROT|nr:RNA methyltransferase [Thalassospira lucentensis]RCK26987.1 RNA methyltransferase [Thalassospira lucentensis MCCC 1A00383 = DSM 14000]HBU96952.1 RNA methyltransferase [Thalassospira lucentensis]